MRQMISIAMATYNGARYLREQLDSILCQSVSDFELVVCDDCSTDETYSILEEYKAKDYRVRIFRNDTNLGFKKNFERVIGLTQGEYVALCDQDDIWEPDHLEVLLNEMRGKALLVCGKPLFVDEDNQELPEEYDYLKMDLVPRDNKGHARHLFLGRSTYQGASMLVKRTFFDVALPIPDGVFYHDSWFAALACLMNGFVYVDKCIMRYRRLTSSVTYADRHVSAFRKFVRQTIHDNILPDRLFMIQGIESRLSNIGPVQKKLLSTFETMHKRKNSVCGRILNLPYRLFYFRSIYAVRWNHIFD